MDRYKFLAKLEFLIIAILLTACAILVELNYPSCQGIGAVGRIGGSICVGFALYNLMQD